MRPAATSPFTQLPADVLHRILAAHPPTLLSSAAVCHAHRALLTPALAYALYGTRSVRALLALAATTGTAHAPLEDAGRSFDFAAQGCVVAATARMGISADVVPVVDRGVTGTALRLYYARKQHALDLHLEFRALPPLGALIVMRCSASAFVEAAAGTAKACMKFEIMDKCVHSPEDLSHFEWGESECVYVLFKSMRFDVQSSCGPERAWINVPIRLCPSIFKDIGSRFCCRIRYLPPSSADFWISSIQVAPLSAYSDTIPLLPGLISPDDGIRRQKPTWAFSSPHA